MSTLAGTRPASGQITILLISLPPSTPLASSCPPSAPLASNCPPLPPRSPTITSFVAPPSLPSIAPACLPYPMQNRQPSSGLPSYQFPPLNADGSEKPSRSDIQLGHPGPVSDFSVHVSGITGLFHISFVSFCFSHQSSLALCSVEYRFSCYHPNLIQSLIDFG